MKERPILFSAPMVRAILDGSKTQTRRIIRPSSRKADGVAVYTEDARGIVEVLNTFEREPIDAPPIRCPYGVPGDRLWVRETWCYAAYSTAEEGRLLGRPVSEDGYWCRYRATDEVISTHGGSPWRPSIHMPRWASRIDLEIVSVRVEHLLDISEDDARAEGVASREAFFELWDELHGKGAATKNPLVWVVEFKRVERSGEVAA